MVNKETTDVPMVRRPTRRGNESETTRYSCHLQGVVGTKRLILSALLVLVFSRDAEGEIYNKTRLEPVLHFIDKDVVFCIRPLGEKPEVVFAAQLMVESTTAKKTIFIAGNTTVEGLSTNEWHNTTINYGTADYVHILDVTVDGQAVGFNKPSKGNMWTSSYKFQEILLLVKGVVEITDCPPPEDPTTTTSTTTTTTTTEAPTKMTMEVTSPQPKSSEMPTTYSPGSQSTQPQAPTSTAAPEDVVKGGSWIWSIGAIGSVPALPLILGLLAFIILISLLILICFRKKRETKTKKSNDQRPEYHSIRRADPAENTPTVFNENNAQSVHTPVPEEEEVDRRANGNTMETFKGYRVSDYHR